MYDTSQISEFNNIQKITKDLSEHGQILWTELSQFERSQDVLLIGFEKKIILAQLTFEDINLNVNILYEFHHPSRCTTIGISPDTCLTILPNMIQFCVGGNDFNLRVFQSDLADNNICKVIPSHTSYINDIKYDPDNMFMASTGDDNVVNVWSVDDYSKYCSFNLSSPGMSLCWHRCEPNKLMVAEKIGTVRFYIIETKTPFLSLDNGKPLASAHWSPAENQLVATLQLGELFVWELTKKCFPIYSTLLFPENGGSVKFSTKGDLIAAVNNLDGTLKVIQVETQTPKLTTNVVLPSNISWHYRYPIICLGDDSKLYFYKIGAV